MMSRIFFISISKLLAQTSCVNESPSWLLLVFIFLSLLERVGTTMSLEQYMLQKSKTPPSYGYIYLKTSERQGNYNFAIQKRDHERCQERWFNDQPLLVPCLISLIFSLPIDPFLLAIFQFHIFPAYAPNILILQKRLPKLHELEALQVKSRLLKIKKLNLLENIGFFCNP